ncbi:MAG: DMT family transporter, partial [Anaerolineales bacterium]
MFYLFIVSIIWAFSFGIIKDALTGLNPNIVAFIRLAISFVLFAPFLRLKSIDRKLALKLMGIGAVQYGLMYITYIYSFQYLKSFQVALFTIFTPLYVTLIHNVYQKHFYKLNFLTTLLTIAGTAIVNGQNLLQWELWVGFLFVQVSNICFAYGQIAYKQLLANRPQIKDQHIFALLYLGAILITAISSLIFADWSKT